ncbi:MAG TPA: enoyl-CoA hydratase/isomerase family protein [Actinomycetota bacterium]|nr:enoyl-CoA hydratase/isomerase family protein [Actinomycetota bacterium]
MLRTEDRNGIVVMYLENGPVNALDGDFLREITASLRSVAAAGCDALILTGAGATFSAGADLKRVLDGGSQYLRGSVGALSDAFGALFTFPRPVVAAINGHAIAGGAVFVCACDYRVMARDSGVIGMAELRAGVPFPTYALEIVRFAVGPGYFQEIVLLADNYSPDDALQRRLIDEIAAAEELVARCEDVARRLARVPSGTFELMKRAIRLPTVERVERNGPVFDPTVLELWDSDPVRESIAGFMDRLGLAR